MFQFRSRGLLDRQERVNLFGEVHGRLRLALRDRRVRSHFVSRRGLNVTQSIVSHYFRDTGDSISVRNM